MKNAVIIGTTVVIIVALFLVYLFIPTDSMDDSVISNLNSNCIAELGQKPNEGCNPGCSECNCTANFSNNYNPKPEDQNILCVEMDNGVSAPKNHWILTSFIPSCPDEGLTGFCLCSATTICTGDCVDGKCVFN